MHVMISIRRNESLDGVVIAACSAQLKIKWGSTVGQGLLQAGKAALIQLNRLFRTSLVHSPDLQDSMRQSLTPYDWSFAIFEHDKYGR